VAAALTLLFSAAAHPLLTGIPDSVLGASGPFVSSAGDVNGDGYGDVMVGYHGGILFLGSASGIASGGWETADARLEGHGSGAQNTAGVGDLNGDGYDDVIAGFDHFGGAGIADVWMGGPSGIHPEYQNHNHIHSGLMSDGYTYGGFYTIAGAGDVNGDGYDDVILTTLRSMGPNDPSEGVAAILHGRANVMESSLNIDQADTLITFPIGHAIRGAGAGDVNGDGYDDVILGMPLYGDAHGSGSGAAMVFHGGPSGIVSDSPPDTMLAANDFGADFGDRVAGAGDVNGDGYDDVIVGSPNFGGGTATLYLGSAAGIPDSLEYYSPTAIQIGPDPGVPSNAFPYFGWSVAGAGDVNGDGYDDVIVGAPYYTDGEQNEGAAFVVLGGANGIAAGATESAWARLESGQALDFFGIGVGSAGDVNGDGLSDVIAAVASYGEADEGAALIYHGEADLDADRTADAADNCRALANPTQLDADADGSGNHCDADFDQDGGSGAADFTVFRRCYGHAVLAGSGPAADPSCAESDMDGDGAVGAGDFVLFRAEYLTPPG
jgi:hypothetical protein